MANPNGRQQLPAISDESVQKFLQLQQHEVALRMEEVKRDNAEIAHNQSIAKQSIEAQERDRKHEREEITRRQKNEHKFSIFIVAAILLFAAYAIYAGQTALVLDIIKVIVAFAGGMGYQAYKASKQRDPDGDD